LTISVSVMNLMAALMIVSMIVLGYLVFGDIPNRWTLAGAGIVIASGLYLIHRERAARRGGL